MGEVYDKKSVYALNILNPDAIVYPGAAEHDRLLTREMFSSDAEFLFWKSWSDDDYHNRAKGDWREQDHTVSIHALSEEVGAVHSPEEVLICRIDRMERGKVSAGQIQLFQSIITEKQFRRLWLYGVNGMTQVQIASVEGVGQRRISKSIAAAKKKINKILTVRKNRG